jgi:hypothetical protein
METPTMRKCEIKKLKTCRGHETDSFSCDFYVEDVLVAHVTQSGEGGCHSWHWTIGQGPGRQLSDALIAEAKAESPAWAAMDDFDEDSEFRLFAADAAKAAAKKKPATKFLWDVPGMQTEILDVFIWHLVEVEGETKRLKRMCKTKTVFRTADLKEGDWMALSTPWTGNETKVREHLQKKYGAKLGEIANERFA